MAIQQLVSCASRRVQVPNIRGFWSQRPCPSWFVGPEPSNIWYLDPSGWRPPTSPEPYLLYPTLKEQRGLGSPIRAASAHEGLLGLRPCWEPSSRYTRLVWAIGLSSPPWLKPMPSQGDGLARQSTHFMRSYNLR